jgi:hypothetical protein
MSVMGSVCRKLFIGDGPRLCGLSGTPENDLVVSSTQTRLRERVLGAMSQGVQAGRINAY